MGVLSWLRSRKTKKNTKNTSANNVGNPFAAKQEVRPAVRIGNIRKPEKGATAEERKEAVDFQAVVGKFVSYLNEKRNYTRKHKKIEGEDEKYLTENFWGEGTEPIPGNSVARRVAARSAISAEHVARRAAEGLGATARVVGTSVKEGAVKSAAAVSQAYQSTAAAAKEATRKAKKGLESDYARAEKQLAEIQSRIGKGNLKNKGEVSKELREIRKKVLESKRYGRRLTAREIAILSDKIDEIKEDFVPVTATPGAATPADAAASTSAATATGPSELQSALDTLKQQLASLRASATPASAAAAPKTPGTFEVNSNVQQAQKDLVEDFDAVLGELNKTTNAGKKQEIAKKIRGKLDLFKANYSKLGFNDAERDEFIKGIEEQLSSQTGGKRRT